MVYREREFYDQLPEEVPTKSGVYWTCPNCQELNVSPLEQIPIEQYERAMRDFLELESWEELPEESKADPVDLLQIPEESQCPECKEVFRLKPPDEGFVV